MARKGVTKTLLAAYCCCWCAIAVLQLAPGVAAAATDAGGGAGRQRRPTAAAEAGESTDAAAAAPATRHKRWSTTFGATSGNKNTTANNGVRECNTDSDCLDTPYTSCGLDPSDKKKRCFCADGKQPLNGDCLKRPRGPLFVPALRTSCETDLECLPNAICKNNATSTNSRLKICTCKDGFVEEKDACNYADLLTFNYTTLFFVVFTSWIWNEQRA